jgi:hypothetical protein
MRNHFIYGVPNEIRTRVTAVKGRCPRPLDDRDVESETEQSLGKSGVPNEIRTRVTAVKGRCPRPLDDRDVTKIFNGGDKQDRTADLLHAMQALSQLSYTPVSKSAHYIDLNLTCKAFSQTSTDIWPYAPKPSRAETAPAPHRPMAYASALPASRAAASQASAF